jgi:hypothetical protein
MNSALRWLNTLLLLAILATLLLIWRRMPPTMAEFKNVKGKDRTALLLRRPYIVSESEVTGSVSISDSPLEVQIMNDSLSVQINQ